MTNIESHDIFADSRIAQWPMMSTPIPSIVISLVYIYFAKVHHATKHFPTIKISVLRTSTDEESKAFSVEESHTDVQSLASVSQYLSLP
jgi:hypothetical protein